MNDLQQIEITEQEAKNKVDLAKSLDRLLSNRDFKKIVTEGYFREEAIRLVMAKSNPHCQQDEVQKAITKDIDAIGSFRHYLAQIEFDGQQALKSLKDCADYREQVENVGE